MDIEFSVGEMMIGDNTTDNDFLDSSSLDYQEEAFKNIVGRSQNVSLSNI